MSDDVFVHRLGVCDSPNVGPRTRVWAFAHVLPGARIGADCNICDHVFVENDVVVGDRVTVKCGVQLWDGVRLEDDVFVGPNATFTNDPFPRSRAWRDRVPETRVMAGASIGANATILPGVVIGRSAMVGAGAVVTANVPANAIVQGNPARVVGYVDADAPGGAAASDAPAAAWPLPAAGPAAGPIGLGGVELTELSGVADVRGEMAFAEVGRGLPFVPARFFAVFNVPGDRARGERAYRAGRHLFACVGGACSLMLDDGTARREIRLDRPTVGVLVPPLVWVAHYRYTEGAVLLAFASDPWREEDQIRDYGEFLEAAASARG
jgi:acetyltransferase-like isoleucine patch superfamily enzyme